MNIYDSTISTRHLIPKVLLIRQSVETIPAKGFAFDQWKRALNDINNLLERLVWIDRQVAAYKNSHPIYSIPYQLEFKFTKIPSSLMIAA
jgi:hypothetical protein